MEVARMINYEIYVEIYCQTCLFHQQYGLTPTSAVGLQNHEISAPRGSGTLDLTGERYQKRLWWRPALWTRSRRPPYFQCQFMFLRANKRF